MPRAEIRRGERFSGSNQFFKSRAKRTPEQPRSLRLDGSRVANVLRRVSVVRLRGGHVDMPRPPLSKDIDPVLPTATASECVRFGNTFECARRNGYCSRNPYADPASLPALRGCKSFPSPTERRRDQFVPQYL